MCPIDPSSASLSKSHLAMHSRSAKRIQLGANYRRRSVRFNRASCMARQQNTVAIHYLNFRWPLNRAHCKISSGINRTRHALDWRASIQHLLRRYRLRARSHALITSISIDRIENKQNGTTDVSIFIFCLI